MIHKYNQIVINIARQFAIDLYTEEGLIDEWNENYSSYSDPYDPYELNCYKWVYVWPLEIWDRYINFDDILTMYANNFTAKSVLAYTDYGLDLSLEWKECKYNYYNYTKWFKNPELYKKEEQESLKKSKKAVEFAKKELEKTIKTRLWK